MLKVMHNFNLILVLKIYVILTLFSANNCVQCFVSYVYTLDYESPDTLKFNTSDVIGCRIETTINTKIYGAEHVMLAINSTFIVHVDANGKDQPIGILKIDNFKATTFQNGYKNCRVATKQYDRFMFDMASIPLQWDYIQSELTTKWLGKSVYYDFTGCNCQHWVTFWKYGKAWSLQSAQPPNHNCSIKLEIRKGSLLYSKPGQYSARADTGSSVYSTRGSVNFQALTPSAGAYAEAGVQNTGAGFKASLGEVRANFGSAVGISAGLKADTYAEVGTDGIGCMVIATGVHFSRTKGTKICLLGACLHIG